MDKIAAPTPEQLKKQEALKQYFEKLGSGFSMAGIPQRIFLLIAKCAGLHTDSDFAHIMELPQEDNGYVSDYLHLLRYFCS